MYSFFYKLAFRRVIACFLLTLSLPKMAFAQYAIDIINTAPASAWSVGVMRLSNVFEKALRKDYPNLDVDIFQADNDNNKYIYFIFIAHDQESIDKNDCERAIVRVKRLMNWDHKENKQYFSVPNSSGSRAASYFVSSMTNDNSKNANLARYSEEIDKAIRIQFSLVGRTQNQIICNSPLTERSITFRE